TSAPAPPSTSPEKFRISRRGADRRKSIPVDGQDHVVNPVPQRAIQSPAHVEEQPLTLANRETRLSEPARPVGSEVTALTNPTPVRQPLAPPMIQRELLESEIKTTRLVLKDSERIKIERQ